ncbi:MAG TPA: SsrA-binding protein SmpB [Aeriscardovia aeriphila]|uniref:SsrA-binding protein n=1 Tax=Aeriscardovia aeriphila TaxID=218139 RepID=A0A921FUT7_9BIFI|nr:SsrA-binding protein SmpB [Aeriscardovia aeriphila]
MKNQEQKKTIATNKRARHDYEIEETLEAGVALTGTEVKSLRQGRASLAQAFVSVDKRGEMWLENANIPEYLDGTWTNHAPRRKRKLLLHKRQMIKWGRAVEAKGEALVPLSLYFNDDGRVKVEVALARGKKEYDKRAALKDAEDKRAMQRALRLRNMRDWSGRR